MKNYPKDSLELIKLALRLSSEGKLLNKTKQNKLLTILNN